MGWRTYDVQSLFVVWLFIYLLTPGVERTVVRLEKCLGEEAAASGRVVEDYFRMERIRVVVG